jgi:hypothetical protein
MRIATINLRRTKDGQIQTCDLGLINLKVTRVDSNVAGVVNTYHAVVKPYKFREGWQVIELWAYGDHDDTCVAYVRINPHTGKYEVCNNTVLGIPDVTLTLQFGADGEKMNHEYVDVANVAGTFTPFQNREIERIIPILVVFPLFKDVRHQLTHKFNPHGSIPLNETYNIVNLMIDGMSPWSHAYSAKTGEVIITQALNEAPNTSIRYLVIYK